MTRSAVPLFGALLIAMTLDASAQNPVTTPSGLKYVDEVVGTGPEPKAGQSVNVHYTGWLDQNGQKGKKFDSSRDRGQPFSFTLGQGQVIAGWDQGVATMKVGGKRTLVIPPQLGYGARGAGGVIPPNATLIFDVELLGAQPSAVRRGRGSRIGPSPRDRPAHGYSRRGSCGRKPVRQGVAVVDGRSPAPGS
jgi:peptidylprolyl isomerase